MLNIKNNLIIMGMKHSGKSTHGRLLAEKFSLPFIDSDDVIEELYQKQHNNELTCREIFKTHGSEFFRQLESDAIHHIYNQYSGNNNAVIALGGGLVTNPSVEKVMLNIGIVVYLKLPYKTLYDRIIENGLPPFLDTSNPFETFIKICNEREPYYLKYQNLTVELLDMPTDEANQLLENNIIRYLKTI